jgi:N-acetylated-alpha-linked acidic dipeptidase
VNYGMPDDYDKLAALGVSVEGKIVLARYGVGYRGIKAKLAEEHKAVGLVIYSDPVDDGAPVGETFPNGPWRPMSGIQRGSVMYTEIYPGDPLTAGVGATPPTTAAQNRKVAPADAANLTHIPTMPINAQDAAVILGEIKGPSAPREWQGGLPISYHVGPGDAELHMKLVMDYRERPIYDVIAKLHGSTDDQWVILGNHHDAWVFGAADPGSGTASMLETARALGDLASSGWKPRRTIVICAWDAEEPGLIGSTAWVEANRAELQAKAVAYINTDMGVTGPGFAAASTPSLRDLIRDVTRDVDDPNTGLRVYEAWGRHVESANQASSIMRDMPMPDTSGEVTPGTLGSGSDFSPFFDYAGIPSIDVGFEGDYGVYHSLYDDFYWMKHFGDPSFVYHATLARILGTMALRLDEADFLPFNYPAYGTEIEHRVTDLFLRTTRDADQDNLMPVLDASAHLSASAQEASRALRAISSVPLDPKTNQQINHALASVEQQLLAPEGLTGRPWFKNTIYAPGMYAGYAAEAIPGIREALDRNDSAMLAHEASSLTAALLRASARLDEVARMAQLAGKSARPGN